MDPFHVSEMKDWATFTPIKDESGKVVSFAVESVREGTPYADAGLEVGMFVRSIRIMNQGEKQGDIILGVTDGAASWRYIVISAEKLRMAPARNSIVAVTP